MLDNQNSDMNYILYHNNIKFILIQILLPLSSKLAFSQPPSHENSSFWSGFILEKKIFSQKHFWQKNFPFKSSQKYLIAAFIIRCRCTSSTKFAILFFLSLKFVIYHLVIFIHSYNHSFHLHVVFSSVLIQSSFRALEF